MRSVVVLVVAALALGAILTGLAGSAPGSQGLNGLTWLGTVATVAALVVAIGIYRVQTREQDAAHSQLLDRLGAQDELLAEFAETTQPGAGPPRADDELTDAQRAKVEEVYGEGSIDAAWKLGAGKRNRPRLVRLKDGRIVSVYSGGRRGGTWTSVHEVKA